jgi:leader peptidase (prepilin peptidase)/N-methyltransferase
MLVHSGLETLNTFVLIISFVLGCMIGSFLNVCIWRLPRNESVIRPRSRCPKCRAAIAWYDNIPIVSWLVLGAKCRHCAETISWQYPLVEAVTGALFCGVYWRFGVALASPVYAVLVAGLILVTFVDLADWTIPNEVTLPGIPLGLVCSVVGMFYPASGLLVKDVFDALIGAGVGGGILYLLDKLTVLLVKKRGMGFGDVKLLAMLGAFLGWKSVPVIIVISSLVGSIVGLTMLFIRKRKGIEQEAHYLPFGPYLALAGLIYLFLGAHILAAYANFVYVPESTPPSVFDLL